MMSRRCYLRAAFVVACLFAAPGRGWAAEPPSPTDDIGVTVSPGGRLGLSGGRLVIALSRGGNAVPLKSLRRVWFQDDLAARVTATLSHQAVLAGGQVLTGELIGFDGTAVRLRRPGSNTLYEIPRSATRVLRHAGGWQPVFADTPGDVASHWTVAGEASTFASVKSGTAGVLLKPGGRAECRFDPRVTGTGAPVRLGVSFDAPDSPGWSAELQFEPGTGNGAVRTIRVTSADSVWAVTVEPNIPGLIAPSPQRRATAGHRLVLESGTSGLVLTVDGHILVYSRTTGVADRLSRLILRSPTRAGAEKSTSVRADGLTVSRLLTEAEPEPVDPRHDEVWTEDGSQFPGVIRGIDRDAVDLQTRGGVRPIPWRAGRGGVRGVSFREPEGPGATTRGEHVRVWFESGGGTTDVLDGVVSAADESSLTLDHPDLGKVRLSRDSLRRLRWEFDGRRSVLEQGECHLGTAGRFAPPVSAGPATGRAIRRPVAIDRVPGEAVLRFEVARGRTAATTSSGAELVISVNARVVGTVTWPERLTSPDWQRVTLRLPESEFRPGDNALGFELTGDRSVHAVVRRVVLVTTE